MASYQDKLTRVRKPRVHITYKVETNGAEVVRELPFVLGVMGDFSGDNKPSKTLSERAFVRIDKDNFNNVMAGMAPKLNLKVENTLAGDGSQMGVDLAFNSMEDFQPARIVDQVGALKTLLEARNKLRDLLSKADRSVALEEELEKILKEQPLLQKLATELGRGTSGKAEE